jgi:rhodanese-related sulfurtransferase
MEPAQLKELIATGKDYYLIDTRSNKEYEAGHIKGAVNIPLYRDYKNVYGSQIKLKEAQAQVNRIKTFNKDVIVYSYSPNAEPMLNFVANMQKMRINIRLLSVGWNQWRNYYTTWMPGADISGEGIENYVEEKQIGPGELVLPPEPPLPSH